MSDSDISVSSLLVKYRENGILHFMHKDAAGNIEGRPLKKGALLYTPKQAKVFINYMKKIGFPFQCGAEAVR